MNPSPYPGDHTRLTDRELATLASIAVFERGADPGFARRLACGPVEGRRRPGPALAAAALAVLGALLLVAPGVWALAVVAVGVLVVGPTVLVVWALRQNDPPPR